ncbi:hypothetical protein KAU34_07735 [candidate division WOR-3 bacterium]|nr:hypothetical protein [candidate division WOR-3 bacterium]
MKTKQCPNCGSFDTYSWSGQGVLDIETVFECHDCGLIIEDGEVTTKGRKEVMQD